MQNTNPFEYVNIFDFVFFAVAFFVRMIAAITIDQHSEDRKKTILTLRMYFLDNRGLNLKKWSIHAVTGLVLLLLLPHHIATSQLNIKYLSSWSYLGSATLGYLGYDAIRLIGKYWNITTSLFIGGIKGQKDKKRKK